MDAISDAVRQIQLEQFVRYLQIGMVAAGYFKKYKYQKYERKRLDKLRELVEIAFEADESWIFSKDGTPKPMPQNLIVNPEAFREIFGTGRGED